MIDPKQVLSQLNDTNAGVAFEYHRGLLAADLKDCNNGMTPLQKKALADLATDLLRLAEAGAIHLVQRRHGPGDYSYFAIMSKSRFRRRRFVPQVLTRSICSTSGVVTR